MARSKLMGFLRKLVVRKRNAGQAPAVNPGPWFMPLPTSLRLDLAIRAGSRSRYEVSRLIWISAEGSSAAGRTLSVTLFNN